MAGREPAPPHRDIPSSLFTQIFALVLATVAVAQLINLALLAVLPPDPPRTMSLSHLSYAVLARDERMLAFQAVPVAPFVQPADPNSQKLSAQLAVLLRADPEDVRLSPGPEGGGRLVEVYGQRGSAPEPALLGNFQLALRDGERWLLVEPRGHGLFDTRERRFMLLFLLSVLIMLPAAFIFARALARPFEQFADAAEALGRDPKAQPPIVRGSAEVERASQAFRQMQRRLQSYVTDRTQMLGAIAHDLRTPLTRLAFRLEALAPAEREGLEADVAEMEAMVKTTLDLARADSRKTERQRLELGSLVEKAAQDLALTGRQVTAEVEDGLLVDGDPVGLRRLVTNLLDNGEIYGLRARARAWRDGNLAVIDIDDDGPGLPAGEEERVFEPFYRLERSRNRGTGGTGLGLSVCRSIARAHGGDVVLENRLEGGLRARATLPLAT